MQPGHAIVIIELSLGAMEYLRLNLGRHDGGLFAAPQIIQVTGQFDEQVQVVPILDAMEGLHRALNEET